MINMGERKRKRTRRTRRRKRRRRKKKKKGELGRGVKKRRESKFWFVCFVSYISFRFNFRISGGMQWSLASLPQRLHLINTPM